MSIVPKIMSKCCELVKLCHINRSGPGFWDTVFVVVGTCDFISKWRNKQNRHFIYKTLSTSTHT